MKLLIATPLYPPDSGGPATYSKLLEENLPKHDIEVALINFGNFRHYPKPFSSALFFFRIWKAAYSAELLLSLDPFSVGLPVFVASRMTAKPYILKIVGDHAWEQGRQRFGITATLDEFVHTRTMPLRLKIIRMIQLRVAKGAARIIVPSAYLRDIVAQGWGIPAQKIAVIHNAVSEEKPVEVPASVHNLAKPLVVSAGRLVPWKGFTALIDAIATIRSRGLPVSLAIIGDGPERNALAERARAILQNDFVMTGQLSHAETFAILKSADVFVLDSLYEGLSHTLIEACLAGIPIIASDIGGNREVIHNGRNGLLVPPENVPLLSDALYRILSDSALSKALAHEARISGVDFSVDAMITKTVDFLTNI
jgi:glycosyltransferase involved in cell wall biosynthesis